MPERRGARIVPSTEEGGRRRGGVPPVSSGGRQRAVFAATGNGSARCRSASPEPDAIREDREQTDRSAAQGRTALALPLVLLLAVLGAPSTAVATSADRSLLEDGIRKALRNRARRAAAPALPELPHPGRCAAQLDEGRDHTMGVLRGVEGKGSFGLPCSTCHGVANPPAATGRTCRPERRTGTCRRPSGRWSSSASGAASSAVA